MTESHIRNVIEAALLAAGKPLQPAELVELFDEGAARPTITVVQATLAALAEEYSTRGIELKETAAGFRIQVRPAISNEISRLWPERPPKYSRALLETLAIIAYRQPITRAEIEAVRGVAVNPNIVKTVIERNWVHVVGHRDVPGRPELLGTTRDFLDYFGLKRLDELPPLAEIKAIGEIKVQFDLPDPGQLPADAGAAEGAPAVVTTGDSEAAGAGDTQSEKATTDAAAEASRSAHQLGELRAGEGATGEGAAGDHAVSDAPVSPEAAHEVPAEDAVAQGTAQHAPDADTPAAVTETANAPSAESPVAPKSTNRGSGRKKRGKGRATADTALHEAEEFAASVDADLSGDDDSSEEDELSAAGPDSSELVAGPRDIDD